MGLNLSKKTKRNNVIQFENEPFDQGSIRLCFKGKIIEGPDTGDLAVVKVFKYAPTRSSYIDASKQIAVYGVANNYARMFSELLLKNGWSKTISFPEPDLVKIDQISIFSEFTPGYFKIGDYICV